MNIGDYLTEKKDLINDQLEQYVREYSSPGRVQDAMLYSIRAGGKRLRPILLLATGSAFGVEDKRMFAAASSLEMIHTYSLIHDDLPAMDNDDVRRGRPTNHKQFDEATAILAGDALLTISPLVIAEADSLDNQERVFLSKELSKASMGMVEGQMLDMLSEDRQISLDELEFIHKNKTGQLLKYSIMAGAFLGKADSKTMRELESMAEALGLVFQIQDDILDVTGDDVKIGKPTGSDVENHKSTYPQLLGLNGAIEQKKRYVEAALLSLKKAGVEQTILSELIYYLSSRDH